MVNQLSGNFLLGLGHPRLHLIDIHNTYITGVCHIEWHLPCNQLTLAMAMSSSSWLWLSHLDQQSHGLICRRFEALLLPRVDFCWPWTHVVKCIPLVIWHPGVPTLRGTHSEGYQITVTAVLFGLFPVSIWRSLPGLRKSRYISHSNFYSTL